MSTESSTATLNTCTIDEDEASILRRSTRYWFTPHARAQAGARQISLRDALLAATAPQDSWSQWYRSPHREFRARGDVAVIVDLSNGAIITVLWHNADRWTDEQAANRGRAA